MSEVFDKIKLVVADKLTVDKEMIFLNTNFKNDFGADSLDVVEILVDIEQLFKVTIPDDKLEKIVTVGDAVSFVESVLTERANQFYNGKQHY
ncbi:MAG TPA: acyl carrier protein [Bacteroidia bacterium]|jgi:acyl carrier protein|nr:acyl carrier protein [Bacteroidia bacterium]